MTVNINQPSIVISASTSSASGTLPAANATLRYVRIVNPTSALCYAASGKGSATATSAFPAVGPNSTETFEKPYDHDTVAVLLSTSTGTISVTPVTI